MKFNLITGSTSVGGVPKKIPAMFKSACESLGVEFIAHDIRNIDLFKLEALGSTDMLYRCIRGKKARIAEKMLISSECSHIYVSWKMVFNERGGSYFLHNKIGIPAIKTVPFIPETDKEIDKTIEELEGFPVIVKIVGGSHGVGVVKVDSIDGFKSLLGYLRTMNVGVLIRQYIDHNHYARLVVVGDRVVASHATYISEDDFRTNAGSDDKKREAREFSDEINEMAVRSVKSLGYETGGVDLLFDKEDGVHLAEVNVPNDFSTTQEVTGVDIAKSMVEHLISKTT